MEDEIMDAFDISSSQDLVIDNQDSQLIDVNVSGEMQKNTEHKHLTMDSSGDLNIEKGAESSTKDTQKPSILPNPGVSAARTIAETVEVEKDVTVKELTAQTSLKSKSNTLNVTGMEVSSSDASGLELSKDIEKSSDNNSEELVDYLVGQKKTSSDKQKTAENLESSAKLPEQGKSVQIGDETDFHLKQLEYYLTGKRGAKTADQIGKQVLRRSSAPVRENPENVDLSGEERLPSADSDLVGMTDSPSELLKKNPEIKISRNVMAKLRKITEKCTTVRKRTSSENISHSLQDTVEEFSLKSKDIKDKGHPGASSVADIILISDSQPTDESGENIALQEHDCMVKQNLTGRELNKSTEKESASTDSVTSGLDNSNKLVGDTCNKTTEGITAISKLVDSSKQPGGGLHKSNEDFLLDDSQALVIDTQAISDSQVIEDSQVLEDSQTVIDSHLLEDSQRIVKSQGVGDSQNIPGKLSAHSSNNSAKDSEDNKILTYDRTASFGIEQTKNTNNTKENSDINHESDQFVNTGSAKLSKDNVQHKIGETSGDNTESKDKVTVSDRERQIEAALLDNTGDESLMDFEPNEEDDQLLDDSQTLIIDKQADSNAQKQSSISQEVGEKTTNLQDGESSAQRNLQEGNNKSPMNQGEIASSKNVMSTVENSKENSEKPGNSAFDSYDMMEDSQRLIIDTQRTDSEKQGNSGMDDDFGRMEDSQRLIIDTQKPVSPTSVNPEKLQTPVQQQEEEDYLMEDSQRLFIDTQAPVSSKDTNMKKSVPEQSTGVEVSHDNLADEKSTVKTTITNVPDEMITDGLTTDAHQASEKVVDESEGVDIVNESISEKILSDELKVDASSYKQSSNEQSTDLNVPSIESTGKTVIKYNDPVKIKLKEGRNIGSRLQSRLSSDKSSVSEPEDVIIVSSITKPIATVLTPLLASDVAKPVSILNEHPESHVLNNSYAQAILRIIDPMMYTISPGERQLTGQSLDECMALGSFICWRSVFDSDAPIYHCPASQLCVHKKFSYSQLIAHLLKSHFTFGLFPNLSSKNLAVGHCGNRYECKVCHFSTAYSIQMLEHIRLHFLNKPYRCLDPGCEKLKFDDFTLKQHLQTHTSNPSIEVLYDEHFHKFIWNHRFICSVCEKTRSLYNVSTYIYHMLMHTSFDVTHSTLLRNSVSYDNGLYSCGTCTYSTRIADAFFEHVRGHVTNGEPMYECLRCKNAYVSINSFKAHQVSLHGNDSPVFIKVATASQPRVEETYRMIHMLKSPADQLVAKTTGNLTTSVSTYTSETSVARDLLTTTSLITNLIGKVLDQPAHDVLRNVRQQLDQPNIYSTAIGAPGLASAEQPLLRKPKSCSDTDEDLLTYLECKVHNFVSTDYTRYILHLRQYHENFTIVNPTTGRGGNNTIAFREGNYICSGCSMRTTTREVFQEHMRCHTLKFPYHCLNCKKDFRDIWSEHSPCWDKGEEHVKMLIKPSPAMDDVMQKLGPNAPATGKNPSVLTPTISQMANIGRPKSNKLTDVLSKLSALAQEKQPGDTTGTVSSTGKDQVIMLDDDSGDEVEIVAPHNNPSTDMPKSGGGSVEEESKPSGHGSRKQKSPRPVSADRSPRAVVMAQNLLESDKPDQHAQSSAQPSESTAIQSGSDLKPVEDRGSVTPPPPPAASVSRDGGPVASSTPARNQNTAELMTSESSPIQKPGDISQMASGSTHSRKRILSYYCMNGYFHCESCKFKLKISKEEDFKYHLYLDLHASSQQKKPCVKCGKIGFASYKDLDCPIVDQIMGELQQQKSQQISPEKRASSLSPAHLPNISLASSTYPMGQNQTTSTGITTQTSQLPAQQGGTQLLCGLVNGKLIPLGSLQMGGGAPLSPTKVSKANTVPASNLPQTIMSARVQDKSRAGQSSDISGLKLGHLPSGITPREKSVFTSSNTESANVNRSNTGIPPPPPYTRHPSIELSQVVKDSVAAMSGNVLSTSQLEKGIDVVEKSKDRLISGHGSAGGSIEDGFLKENKMAAKEKQVKSSTDQQNVDLEIIKSGVKYLRDVAEKEIKEMAEEKDLTTNLKQNVKSDVKESQLEIEEGMSDKIHDVISDVKASKRPGGLVEMKSEVVEKKAKNDPPPGEKSDIKDKTSSIENQQQEALKSSVNRESLKHKLDEQPRDKNEEDVVVKKMKSLDSVESDVVEIGDSSSEEEIDDLENQNPKEITKQKTILKCDIINGNYVCLSCNFSTINGKKFKQHLWKHVHKKSTKCEHLGPNVYDKMSKCPIIIALIQFLVKKINGNQLEPQEKIVFEKNFDDDIQKDKPKDDDGIDVEFVSVQPSKPIEIETDEEAELETRETEARRAIMEVDGKSAADHESDGRPEADGDGQSTIEAEEEEGEDGDGQDQDSADDEAEGSEEEDGHSDTDEIVEFQQMMPSEPIYRCAVGMCRFSHDDKLLFINHLATRHGSEKRLRCRCCKSQLYYTSNDLCLHLERRDREVRKFGCVICGFTVPVIESFERHLQEEHPNKKAYYCSYCETPFPNVAGLIAHLNMSVKKAFKCPYCEKNAPTRKNVLLHLPRGHVGLARKAIESTMVYCENKENPGHRIIGKKPSGSPKKMGVMHGDPTAGGDSGPNVEGMEQSGGSDAQNVNMPPPSNIPLSSPNNSSNIDRQGFGRQDSGFEGAGSNMECQFCKFVAFSKSQLEHHELWHEDPNAVDVKAFGCSLCPCTVEQLPDFKFHLQFHPGDHKLKYYKCAGCSYKCSSEDGIEKHHLVVHGGGKGDSSSDDEDATYMVAKLKVAFHNGRFMCPKENCTEAYTNVVELQEHSVQAHGNPLSDDHRHDFYKAKTDTNNSNGNGFGISVNEPALRGSNDDAAAAANVSAANKKNELKSDSAGKGSNYGGGGRKHDDIDNNDIDDDGSLIIADDMEQIDIAEDSTRQSNEESDNEDFIQGDISQFNIENDNSGLRIVNDLGDISNITKYHCEMCEFGTNEYDDLQNHIELLHPGGKDDMSADNLTIGSMMNDSAMDSTTEENIIVVQPEEVASEISDESRPASRDDSIGIAPVAFATPVRTSLRQCTVCPYSTIYRKSYKKHMETHEKFKTFTGNAFKCAFCAFISQAKSPTMKHIKTFHADKPSKMFYIRLVNGNSMSEMEMMFEFGASASKSEKSKRDRKFSAGSSTSGISSMAETLYNGGKSVDYQGPADDQLLYEFEETLPQQIVFESLIKCPKCPFESQMREELIHHLRTHLFSRNSMEREVDMEDDLDRSLRTPEKTSSEVKIKTEGGEIPSHQDPDWFMELTKEEAAFCNKVTGLMLYQCKLCMYMDQSSAQVRVHYVDSHPDQLPILCGHCRERLDEDTFRQHHRDCHPLHPVKMIKLVLPSQRGKKHLDLSPGELELEEVLSDNGGLNDWTEAMRPFVSAKSSGTYACNFCGYSQYGTSALKRHVFPIHFKHYPYECAYCQIGMTQVNQMKSHIQKMHPSLPIRIRKPLPPNPTEEEIEKVPRTTATKKESTVTWHNNTPNTMSRTYSPSSGRGQSPASSSTSKTDRDSLLSPTQIKQEVDDAYSPLLNTVDSISQSNISSSGFTEPLNVPRYPVEGSTSRSGGVAVRSYKKVFKCHYCNHTSKWTARDVQRHILTTHLGLKLFNCCYCDFGCYSRNRLEGHVFTEHPQKPFRVANLDKRMNSVQVVQETEDGVDILALHKPDGEPVWTLDPSKRDSLRKYTLSGKYVATTSRAPNKSYQRNMIENSSDADDATQAVSMPVIHQEPSTNLGFSPFADDDGEDSGDGQLEDSEEKTPTNRYMLKKLLMQAGDRDLTPQQMGQMMRRTVPKSQKVTCTNWKCLLCGLTLLRCDRIKYHIICHHWKMRPYRCIHCNTMKYQREPIMQHSQESHPGLTPGAVSVCEEKADALAKIMEKIETDSPSEALELQNSSVMDKHYVNPDHQPLGVLKKPGLPRPKAGGLGLKNLAMDESTGDSSLMDENSSESYGSGGKMNEVDDLYKCIKCTNCIGDLSTTRDHVLKVHLHLRLYTCDFCDASRNDIESMIQHIQKIHPDESQRFSHAYGKYKDDIDACMAKANSKDEPKNEAVAPMKVDVEGQYKCCRCSNFTGNLELTRDHVIKVHFRHRLYICDFCDAARNDMESIIQHIKKIHPNNPLNFTHAYDKFKQEIDSCVKPVVSEKSPRQENCPACKKACKNQADLDWHLAEDHPEFVKYQCGHCPVMCSNKHDLKEHMVDEHQEKPPDYTFVRNLPASMLKKDSLSPKLPRIPPKVIKICKLCGFATDCLANLNHHMESKHLSLVLFKCKLCSALHKSKDDLLTHYGSSHQNDPLQYKVVSLGAEDDDERESSIKSLTSPKGTNLLQGALAKGKDLSVKSKSSTGSKPTARKSTTQSSFPKIKIPTPPTTMLSPTNSKHYDNRRIVIRYECKHCNYTTKECVTIRRHVMTHINYKPYSCPLCTLSSIRSNCIKTHIKLHHKDFSSHPRYNKDPKMETMVHQSIIKVMGNRAGTIEEISMLSSDTMPNNGNHAEYHSSAPAAIESSPASFAATERHSIDRHSVGSTQSSGGSLAEDGENDGGPGVKYSCKLCGYSYHGSSQNIRRHVMVHFNYRKYHCPYCDFTAIQSNNVTQHVQGIHDQESVKYLTVKYKCSYCDFKTVQSHGVIKHVRGVHEGQPPKYETLRDEDIEKKLDDAIIKYGPDSSPLEMNRRKKLEKVKIERGKVKPAFGHSRSFGLSSLGRRSQLGVNKPRKLRPDQIVPPKPGQCLYYKCKICNFTENSSSRKCTNIRRHVMSHLNYKRYVCPYCPFGSTTTCMTKAHTARKHIGKRVYWLDKKDTVMEKLMRANIIKVGGKPWTTYNYEDAGATLKGKSKLPNGDLSRPPAVTSGGSLKSPMQPIRKVSVTHSDRMSAIHEVASEDRGYGHYQCKMCKKRLANSSAIKRHVAAHFHYRRYGCPYCELLFTQSTFAINHVRAKHKGSAIYYMDNKDNKMEQKIRRAWVNLSIEEDPTELFTLEGIVRGAGKRKIKKPQRALQDMEVVNALCNNYDGFVDDNGSENFDEENESMDFTANGEDEVGLEAMNGDIDDQVDDTVGGENGEEQLPLGTSVHLQEATPTPIGIAVKPSNLGEMKGYRCVQCQYETEHKTSMMRHIMWKIGYKPYQCSQCSFQDVLSIGLRKHSMRKHKETTFNPIITKDPEKEKEVEDLLMRSTVQLPKGSRVDGKGLLDELDEGVTQGSFLQQSQQPLQGDDPSYVPKLPFVDFVFVKQEPQLDSGYGDEQLSNQNYDSSLMEGFNLSPMTTAVTSAGSIASASKVTKGHKTSDEPIPDEVIRTSVNKNKCEICGKISTSKGYIYNHVIRHGPPKLRCVYCEMCFYFPKEAKIHSARKHPEVPLKVKRLWGTSNWDKKTEGIEPADENNAVFPAKIPKIEPSDDTTSLPELADANTESVENSFSLINQTEGIQSEAVGGLENSNGSDSGGLDLPVFPQPERSVVPVSSVKETVVEPPPKPSEMEFEDSVMERTPIRIPRKDPRTGVYRCAFCTYTTKNPNHIKCHVLVHDPPHWRCDHCQKKFMMLYKLRKHCSTVHKGQVLKYTNLVTGENCIGTHINYVNAILTTTPANYHYERKASFAQGSSSSRPAGIRSPQGQTMEQQQSVVETMSDKNDDDLLGNESECSGNGSDWGEVSLFCPKCRFNTISEQELLGHFLMHSKESENDDEPNGQFKCVLCSYVTVSADDFNEHHYTHILYKPYACNKCEYTDYLRAGVLKHIKSYHTYDVGVKVKKVVRAAICSEESDSLMAKLTAYQHIHPEVELRDFLQLPIELLHAFMVQNGLSEIHQ